MCWMLIFIVARVSSPLPRSPLLIPLTLSLSLTHSGIVSDNNFSYRSLFFFFAVGVCVWICLLGNVQAISMSHSSSSSSGVTLDTYMHVTCKTFEMINYIHIRLHRCGSLSCMHTSTNIYYLNSPLAIDNDRVMLLFCSGLMCILSLI
jgi:hypothetical protein